ncbi:TIGR03086 family metal-binding protein [Spongiactinospora sp. TRM90649]|uniref:TIGR03086 family metal-binding protein n=1 Tax=Spongiactinospora sp. TRM90649 TaxID=3031114 RepID=UPI0023F941F5|nr:TIGR03086 family metal-binding protein [Spongiactinospora sp. TRM90649]MDF5756755.1 TIGR03086 family metal-binding protein [Spongiactinospora sp. TRM90649]
MEETSIQRGDTPSGWPILDEAYLALRTAVRGVADGDWELPTPCEAWNVTQVVQHASGDQVGYAGFITGGRMPTEDPFAPSGKVAGSPVDLAEEAMTYGTSAWVTVEADAEAVPVPIPVPGGTLPARAAVAVCALDAAVHAWDIAAATGQPSTLRPETARALLAATRDVIEPFRGFAFATPVPPGEGDDDAAVLLRHLGRDPGWRPPAR